MKHSVINLLLLLLILVGIVLAQGPGFNRKPRVEEIFRMLLSKEAVQSQTETQVEIAKRREAQHKEQQFLLKAERVVETWSALAREYKEKGTFNVKAAREVSKAFHDLEKAEGWPKTAHR